MTCVSVGLVITCQLFFVTCEIVYWWVMTDWFLE